MRVPTNQPFQPARERRENARTGRRQIQEVGPALAPEARDTYQQLGLDPGQLTPAQRDKLDRDRNGTITRLELDLNADQQVSRNELNHFQQSASGSSVRLNTPPRALPERVLTGPPLVQVNNPETVTSTGLQFSTDTLDPPMALGNAENPRFRYYSYANLNRNAGQNGGPPQSRFDPVRPVYQALWLKNPDDSGQTTRLHLRGSSYTKTEVERLGQFQGPDHPLFRAPGGNVRKADYQLSQDLIRNRPNLKTPDQGLELKPGEQLLAYVRVEPTGVGYNDLRAFYEFEARPPLPGNGLDMRVALTQDLPEGVATDTPRLVTRLKSGQTLPDSFNRFGETADLQGQEQLKQGSRLAHPAELIPDMQLWRKRLAAPPPEWLRTDALRPETCRQLVTRLDQLIRHFGQQTSATPETLNMMHAWNIELKTTQQLLASAGQKGIANALWDLQFKLGRVNGVINHSEIQARHAVTLGQGQEDNFIFLTNPLNRAGSEPAPGPEVEAMTRFPDGRPANLEKTSYGEYGMTYRIQLDVHNPTAQPQALNLALGTVDEYGHADPLELFDRSQSFLDDTRARYTGALKLSVNGQSYLLNMIHGRIQAPENVADLAQSHFLTSLPASAREAQRLRTALSQLSPGRHEILLEFAVPTNDTGPHLLQIRS